MNQQMYKKGHMLVWVGFLGLFLGNLVKVSGGSETLGSVVVLAFFALFVYGNSLVLQSKNRSMWWLISTIGVFTAVIIFNLKDRSPIVNEVKTT